MEQHKGLFIVFEGVDGSGTTTQLKRFAEHVSETYQSLPHLMREPSNYPAGKLVRECIEQNRVFGGHSGHPHPHNAEIMALLFAADRLHHMGVEGDMHFDIDCVVLSDRYDLSSLYQLNTTATDLSRHVYNQWLRELNRFARRPDVTVVLDVSFEVAAERRRARGGPTELFDDADLQRRLVEAYLHAEQFLPPDDLMIHIDGDRDEDAVAASVVEALTPHLKAWHAKHVEYLQTGRHSS